MAIGFGVDKFKKKGRLKVVVKSSENDGLEQNGTDNLNDELQIVPQMDPDLNNQSNNEILNLVTDHIKKISSLEIILNKSIEFKNQIFLNAYNKISDVLSKNQPVYSPNKIKMVDGKIIIHNEYNVNYSNPSNGKTITLSDDKPKIIKEKIEFGLFLEMNIKKLPRRDYDPSFSVATDSGLVPNVELPTDPSEKEFFKDGLTIKNSVRSLLGKAGISEIIKMISSTSKHSLDWVAFRMGQIQVAILLKENLFGTRILPYREEIVTNYNIVQLPLDVDSRSEFIRNSAMEVDASYCIGKSATNQFKALIFLNKQLPFIVENGGKYLSTTHIGNNNTREQYTVYTDDKDGLESLLQNIQDDRLYFTKKENLIVIYNTLARLFHKESFESKISKVTSNLILEATLIKDTSDNDLVSLVENKIPQYFGILECWNSEKIQPNGSNYSRCDILIQHLLYSSKVASLFTWLIMDTIESQFVDIAYKNKEYLTESFKKAKETIGDNILNSDWVGKLIRSCDGGVTLQYHKIYRNLFNNYLQNMLNPKMSKKDQYNIILEFKMPISIYILTNRGVSYLNIGISEVINGNKSVGLSKKDQTYYVDSRRVRSFLENVCNTVCSDGVKDMLIKSWRLSFGVKTLSAAIDNFVIQKNLQNNFNVNVVHSNLTYSCEMEGEDDFEDIGIEVETSPFDPFSPTLQDSVATDDDSLPEPTFGSGGGGFEDDYENKKDYGVNTKLLEHAKNWRKNNNSNVEWVDKNIGKIVCLYMGGAGSEELQDWRIRVLMMEDFSREKETVSLNDGLYKNIKINKEMVNYFSMQPITWTKSKDFFWITESIFNIDNSIYWSVIDEYLNIWVCHLEAILSIKRIRYYIENDSKIKPWIVDNGKKNKFDGNTVRIIILKYYTILYYNSKKGFSLSRYLIAIFEDIDNKTIGDERNIQRVCWLLTVEYFMKEINYETAVMVRWNGLGKINEINKNIIGEYVTVFRMYEETAKLTNFRGFSDVTWLEIIDDLEKLKRLRDNWGK